MTPATIRFTIFLLPFPLSKNVNITTQKAIILPVVQHEREILSQCGKDTDCVPEQDAEETICMWGEGEETRG